MGSPFKRAEGGALDHGEVVAGELVVGEELAHLHLDELEELLVVDEVDLVHEDHDVGHADLAGEQDVLARLRHGAVGGGDDEDRPVHLRRARDHVLHVVGVAGAVDVGVVPLVGLVLHVGRGDGDPALALLGRVVDGVERAGLAAGLLREHRRDGRRERGLAVVHVADRADVHVRLRPLKRFLCHGLCLLVMRME